MVKKKCIISDFDGTISSYMHREHLRNNDWDKYIEESKNDTPCPQIVEIINRFRDDHTIIILSARGEKCRAETVKWLEDFDIYYDNLILKPDNDLRDDCIAKIDLIHKIEKEYEVFFCLDDRSSCIKSFRDIGLYALQCGEGY